MSHFERKVKSKLVETVVGGGEDSRTISRTQTGLRRVRCLSE